MKPEIQTKEESHPDLDPTLIPKLKGYWKKLGTKVILAVALSFVGALPLIMWFSLGASFPTLYVTLLLGVLVALCASILMTTRSLRGIELSTERLAQTNDLQLVGTLVDVLQWAPSSSTGSTISIKLGLTRLLPQLRAEHANLLTSMQKRLLYAYVDRFRQNETQWQAQSRSMSKEYQQLLMAILEMMGNIGDKEALRVLDKLVAQTPKSETQTLIHQAAQEAKVKLEVRLATLEETRTLLRASNSPQHTEELLRPSTNQTESSELLLRPSERDEA